MSLISSQQVVVQNGCVQEVDSLLQNVQFCHSSTMPSDKATDAGTGSKAQKILQYGSRHTIQNTGWTTRLSCEQSTRRNPFPTVQKLPLPAMSGFRPLYPHLPFISVTRPTVLKLPLSAPATAAVKTGTVVNDVASGNQHVGVQSTASSVAQCTVVSGTNPLLRSIITQTNTSVSALSGSSCFTLNPAVLTMPTIDSHAAGKPAALCFIPVSSVICAPVPGLSTDVRVIENVASPFPSTLASIQNLNLGPLFTRPSAADGSVTVVTSAATKPLSSASVVPAKEVVTWSSDGQVSGVKMLTMKVHIDHGHITEVTEVPEKQAESLSMHTNALTSAVVLGAAKAGQICMDHVDTNGAQFGYHDLTDGSRIRIARDTSGQRHAPIFLLPECGNFCPFEECSVELKTSTDTEPKVVPEEADVSEVGTVFTYEPLFVSEQTLMPLPKKKIRPYDSNVSLSEEDESNYYYRCYLCPFISRDHATVCKHWVNVHLTELPYCCPYCDRTFFTSTKAQVHVQCQHKGSSTTVAFQRSRYFANTLSYQLGESDIDEASDSDEGEEQQVVLEQLSQQRVQQRDSAFGCHKCRFKTRSSVEMRQHVKFVHGHGHFTLVKPGVKLAKAKNNNVQSHATGHLLQAEIAWSNISEKMIVSGEQWFKCRWCAFQVKDSSLISLHVLRQHNWPAAVLCPSCSCNLQLTDDDRRSTSVVCYSCKAKILLAASTDDSSAKEAQDVIFMCNICAFKTRGKSIMCRHIKYNHTKCRPFTCVYCNYVAVERAQVKIHITSHHPEQAVVIKERTEASDHFYHIFDNLFPKLVSVQTGDVTEMLRNEDGDGTESESGRPAPSSDVGSPLFTCIECKLETSSLEQLISHQHRFHKSTLSANAAMVPPMLDGQTEHFKCKICGYCCLDRSCMSRHVKYMHITARPHSCMYCSYNNVEKTKVRLHIMAHHPGRPKTVRTNYKVLEEMSWQAKHFYVEINRTGEVIDEDTGVSNIDQSSPVDRPRAASLSSSDSELPEDLLTGEHHVDDDNAASIKKEEGTGMADDDDDVDVDFYPRRNRVDDDALLNSIFTLDHNYAGIFTPDSQASVHNARDASVMIKQEPLDVDYKDEVSDMLDAEFGSSYLQSENNGHPEVKTEIADDFFSAAADSPNSFEMSESDDDDFYDTEKSDESSFDSEHFSDGQLCSDAGESVRKKIRVSFGVDPAVEESVMVESVVIDSDVWEDPKMHMTPVVELEDVLQIILAWQQDGGETGDIM